MILSLLVAESGCAHWRLVDTDEPNPRALERLQRETAVARGLPFRHDVEVEVLDDEGVRNYFETRFSASPAYFDAQTKVSHKLGVLPGHVHLADLYKRSYSRNAAALYESSGEGRMLLFAEAFPLIVRWPLEVLNFLTATDWLNELIVSHELVHALQDQHFDLERVLPARLYAENEDAALAHKAIVESEANLVSYAHVFKTDLDSFVARNLLLEYLLGTSWLTLGLALVTNEGSASFYTKVMTHQYFHGMRFLQHVSNQAGGYEGVTRAYLVGLPDSTEQLLWPEKLTAEGFDPPKPLAPLGEEALPGWTLLDENTFGELSLRTLFEMHMSLARAKKAAKGWGGDRYHVLERDGRVLLAWRFLMDSAKDADELAHAYREVLAGKYPRRMARRISRGVEDGWELWRVSPSRNDEGVLIRPGVPTSVPELVALRVEGGRVLVLEGLDPSTWRDDAERAWAATKLDEAATIPSAPPVLSDATSLPPKVERIRPGLEQAFFLRHHEMEMRLGVGSVVHDQRLSFFRVSHLRWGFRPNLELSLPLALSTSARAGPLLSVVTVGAPGVLEDPGLFSLSVTEALLFEDFPLGEYALALQLRAQTDIPDLFPWKPGAFVGGALGGYARFFDRVTLALGAGYEREATLTPSHTAVIDRLVLGSALRRGFVDQPLLELRLYDGLHAWASARLTLDAGSYAVRERRFGVGVSVYF